MNAKVYSLKGRRQSGQLLGLQWWVRLGNDLRKIQIIWSTGLVPLSISTFARGHHRVKIPKKSKVSLFCCPCPSSFWFLDFQSWADSPLLSAASFPSVWTQRLSAHKFAEGGLLQCSRQYRKLKISDEKFERVLTKKSRLSIAHKQQCWISVTYSFIFVCTAFTDLLRGIFSFNLPKLSMIH